MLIYLSHKIKRVAVPKGTATSVNLIFFLSYLTGAHHYVEKDCFSTIYYDATSVQNKLDFHCEYIIHGASNASPNKIVKEPVETMFSNFVGINYLLDYAKKLNKACSLHIKF